LAAGRVYNPRMPLRHAIRRAPRQRLRLLFTALALSSVLTLVLGGDSRGGFGPGERVLLDAHNAYPYEEQWADRIDRALATGVPIAIEQDLVWYCAGGSRCRSLVSHGEPLSGREPRLREHFFERVRPLVTRALARGDRREWPLVILNLDFKTNEPEHHAAIWALLGEYEAWLTTATRVTERDAVAPLTVGPLLVLTGDDATQEASFHDRVRADGRLRLFGAVEVSMGPAYDADAPLPSGGADALAPREVRRGPRTNYRRWWNNPWAVVEGGGQRRAGAWTREDATRLRTLVDEAHGAGLWIRFYTLNGYAPGQGRGWHEGYNFGSRAAVEARWRATRESGVDFVATDQYEDYAAFMRR
jgi:hypothetical protein